MDVAVILMLETLFTGLEKWFNKLENQCSQAGDIGSSSWDRNSCGFFLETKKIKINTCWIIPLYQANFGLNIVFHFTLPLRTFSIFRIILTKTKEESGTSLSTWSIQEIFPTISLWFLLINQNYTDYFSTKQKTV